MIKAVAYLDLLGFRDYTRNDTVGALRLLENYYTILQTKLIDGELHPVSSYKEELQKFATKHLLDSFETIIPFSDCIFITAVSPDKFVMQLSSFLIDCFLINSDQFMRPKKKGKPTEVAARQIGLTKEGTVVEKLVKQNWYPIMFRGGIAYGEVVSLQVQGVSNSEKTIIPNLMGKAIVEAVTLEKEIKGPRMVISESFYSHLSKEIQYYTKPLHNGAYEILWPAYFFNDDEKCSDNELFKIRRLLLPALLLKKAIGDPKVAIHYMYFADLIIESCVKNFKRVECLDKAKQILAQIISGEGLD
jgi:hypothetical protein